MELKIWFLAACIALTEAFYPLLFESASSEDFDSLPASPKLLLLAGLVTLVLLLLPSSSSIRSHSRHNDSSGKGGGKAGSRSSKPSIPDSPKAVKLDQTTRHRSAQAMLDVHSTDKNHNDDLAAEPCCKVDSSKLSSSSARDAGPFWSQADRISSLCSQLSNSIHQLDAHPWTLLLLSALCSTAANNISLGFLEVLPCYAFCQLALLRIIATVVVSSSSTKSSSSNSSSRLRTSFNVTGQAALGMLFIAVCAGQGVFGGAPQPPPPVPEEASVIQTLPDSLPEQPLGQPVLVIVLAILAAMLSALATHFLTLSQHIHLQQHRDDAHQVQQQHLVVQCALGVLCNVVWFLVTEGDFEGFFEDMIPSCWHGVLLLGAAGMLSSALTCSNLADEVIAKAYSYQAAVLLSAWGSGVLLQSPQSTLFAFCSLLTGAAVLLLHSSQHEGHFGERLSSDGKGSETAAGSWSAAANALVSGELDLRPFRQLLTQTWVLVTLALLFITGWASIQHRAGLNTTLAFSHPASAQAMAKSGITLEAIQATTDEAFPSDTLYLSTSWAVASAPDLGQASTAQAQGASGNDTGGARAAAGAPLLQPPGTATAGMHSPAWTLCPSLTCSRHESCTPQNTSCCAHLHLHMMAFWNAFMHAHDLDREYVLLHETLRGAVSSEQIAPDTEVLHMGVSAAAAATLEEECLKQKLWQYGYAFFLQDNSWRLCAHRGHPSSAFQYHMHPVRHLTPVYDDSSLRLHLMWPHTPRQQQQQQQESQLGQQQPELSLQQQPKQADRMARLLGIGAGWSSWRLCPSGAVLSTREGSDVSVHGLVLPRPSHAVGLLGRSYAAHQQATKGPELAATCDKLVSELLVRTGY